MYICIALPVVMCLSYVCMASKSAAAAGNKFRILHVRVYSCRLHVHVHVLLAFMGPALLNLGLRLNAFVYCMWHVSEAFAAMYSCLLHCCACLAAFLRHSGSQAAAMARVVQLCCSSVFPELYNVSQLCAFELKCLNSTRETGIALLVCCCGLEQQAFSCILHWQLRCSAICSFDCLAGSSAGLTRG